MTIYKRSEKNAYTHKMENVTGLQIFNTHRYGEPTRQQLQQIRDDTQLKAKCEANGSTDVLRYLLEDKPREGMLYGALYGFEALFFSAEESLNNQKGKIQAIKSLKRCRQELVLNSIKGGSNTIFYNCMKNLKPRKSTRLLFNNALQEATKHENYEIMDYLINKKANVCKALVVATSHDKSIAIIQWLLPQVFNQHTHEEATNKLNVPLLKAVEKNRIEIFKVLIRCNGLNLMAAFVKAIDCHCSEIIAFLCLIGRVSITMANDHVISILKNTEKQPIFGVLAFYLYNCKRRITDLFKLVVRCKYSKETIKKMIDVILDWIPTERMDAESILALRMKESISDYVADKLKFQRKNKKDDDSDSDSDSGISSDNSSIDSDSSDSSDSRDSSDSSDFDDSEDSDSDIVSSESSDDSSS